MPRSYALLWVTFIVCACGGPTVLSTRQPTHQPREVSGIYPHLAVFNDENECGIGAVVPWAGRLWVVTYAPHAPQGSSDKLYEITDDLHQIVREESIGGTPANRLIHRESQQLFIGPYVIDAERHVRVIPYTQMFGRLTGTARHLSDPAAKVYCATMEEGLYEIDVHTLAVTELWADEQRPNGRHADLPGYHGKGLYAGQGRLVYTNNGEHGAAAMRDPTTPSGVLAEWDGVSDAWTIVRRNQFTEVTGPGGIHGNHDATNDPLWAVGWDHRSLLLHVLDGGVWHAFRLPKGSHSYDGAHGWNTEWPRIRDVGDDDLLMTMHGLLWRFPRAFTTSRSGGIAPRSAYLKVVGDFCGWHDRVVFGCDDTAKSEFLNKRRAKGEIAAPRSQSNLWFVPRQQLDAMGPPLCRGGVWVHEDVTAGTRSEPFLIAGFDHGGLQLAQRGESSAQVVIEVDRLGNGDWRMLQETLLPARGQVWIDLGDELRRACTWLRVRAPTAIHGATAFLSLSRDDDRDSTAAPIFDALARAGDATALGGLVRARGGKATSLAFAAMAGADGTRQDRGCFELDGALQLTPTSDAGLHRHTLEHARIPTGVLTIDAASVLYVDDAGRRWRLPKGAAEFDDEGPLGACRVAREVATERDLFHAHGTFYELPADNAGGFAKVRPIASHDRLIHDFCSFRGLLVMTGIAADASREDPHVVWSADGAAALWVGAIDDLWRLGKPRGVGGPWRDSPAAANVPSDPYLVTGYDRKRLELSHDALTTVTVTLEADLCGDGRFVEIRELRVASGETLHTEFPRGWSCYWVRCVVDRACVVTAQWTYD